jgi:transcriptional regulator with XRE-family HTH domain
MDLLSVIRRWALRDELSIREIARRTSLSRNTIRKYIRSDVVEVKFKAPDRVSKLDAFSDKLSGWLKTEASKPRKQKHTHKQLHADLVALGFTGSYGRVAAFARAWKAERSREQQYNRRFLQMCGHYLVDPVACMPASGWEKGQVEYQVGLVRERFFTPRLRFKTYEELNAWLLDKCVAYAKTHRHPEIADKSIWEAFEEERPKLVPLRSRFDGFHAVSAAVSKTCLVRFDNNKYSVKACAVGHPVEIHAYADRIVIRQDGVVVAEHRRVFGREATIYDPWHYVPVLARKPGALRNGAPFKDWLLPAAMEKVRSKLTGSADGDRQMVKILAAVLDDGLATVEAACAEALDQGVHSADVVLNILARRRDPGPPLTILTPDALKLKQAPLADCARYDSIRRTG